MSANPPQQLEGTQAPSQIEFLWERYRRHFNLLVILGAVGLGGFYLFKAMQQRARDAHWSSFSATVGLDGSYVDATAAMKSVVDSLGKRDIAQLEKGLVTADASQKPYILLAIARLAIIDRNWDRAEKALQELERDFPKHTLVAASDYPVQIREPIKKEKETTDDRQQANKKPELKPAKAGSAVSLLREQIAAGKAYTPPSHFTKQAVPADAPKVKFEFGESGSLVVALMVGKAPKHCEEFLKLAKKENGAHWIGLSVDEIQRNGSGFNRHPKQMHLGFETTKEIERSKWTKTDPSKYLVDFESNDLSHFEGAVSARQEADGKSCADRLWITAEDAAQEDGQRVIFGYIVDGLDTVKRICEASLSAEHADSGVGTPIDKVTVTAVTVLQ